MVVKTLEFYSDGDSFSKIYQRPTLSVLFLLVLTLSSSNLRRVSFIFFFLFKYGVLILDSINANFICIFECITMQLYFDCFFFFALHFTWLYLLILWMIKFQCRVTHTHTQCKNDAYKSINLKSAKLNTENDTSQIQTTVGERTGEMERIKQLQNPIVWLNFNWLRIQHLNTSHYGVKNHQQKRVWKQISFHHA